MDDSKITIVTAFFPLNREKWNEFGRSNEKYIENFKFWARIQNDMIIYTDEQSKQAIEQVRKDFKRENTKIVVVDDFRKIDESLYERMDKITKNSLSVDFRLMPKNPEVWNTDYNFVMLLKEWCVQDAVEKGYAKGMIAWVDFGYNHGGVYYTKPEEFNFEWKYPFSKKIHIFNVNELDELPIFEVCRRMNSYIIGGVVVAPDYLWAPLWKMVKENMIALNKCGLIDDDQTLLLMAYQENKEMFEIHPTQWFSTIKDFSNHTFSVNEKKDEKKIGYLRKKRIKFSYKKRIAKYLYRWYQILKDTTLKG